MNWIQNCGSPIGSTCLGLSDRSASGPKDGNNDYEYARWQYWTALARHPRQRAARGLFRLLNALLKFNIASILPHDGLVRTMNRPPSKTGTVSGWQRPCSNRWTNTVSTDSNSASPSRSLTRSSRCWGRELSGPSNLPGTIQDFVIRRSCGRKWNWIQRADWKLFISDNVLEGLSSDSNSQTLVRILPFEARPPRFQPDEKVLMY